MKVKFNGEKWIELEKNSIEGVYIDGFLKKKLDNIRTLIARNWDALVIIDGKEGSGKSTLGQTIGYYLTDTELTVNNFCAGANDAIEKLRDMPDKSLLIIDEGSLLFSSREALRAEQIQIIKILNVIRQKNMILIIIAPSFFDLNKYISVHRSRFLLHVYTGSDLKRGRVAYFGEKKKAKLYEIGKKNFNSYNKPKADFICSFTDFNPLGHEYDAVKKKSLMESLTTEKKVKPEDVKKELLTKIILNNEKVGFKLTQKQLSELFGVSDRTIQRYKAPVTSVTVSADE